MHRYISKYILQRLIIPVSIAGACICIIFAQQNTGTGLQQAYKEAVRLYLLEEPTAETDSTALALFNRFILHARPGDADEKMDACIRAGNIHQGYQRFDSANRLYHQALQLANFADKADKLTYEAYLYIGSSHYFSNILDSSRFYFEAASEIAMRISGKDKLPELDRLYNSLGALYYESANYQQSKNYFQNALQYADPMASDYQEFHTGIMSNIASCLMKQNRFDSALQILQTISPVAQQKNLISQNTAHCLFELGQYDTALQLYQILPLPGGFSSVVALTDMGRIYMEKRQWQRSEAIFDSAIALNRSISTVIKNKEEALAYYYRGELALMQGLEDEAVTWYNEALQELHLDFKAERADDLPGDVSKSISPITLFTVLQAKAALYHDKYKRTKKNTWIRQSLRAFRKSIETANVIKMNFDNDEATLFFNTRYRSMYDEAIHVAYLAYQADAGYADDYIFMLEQYKGNVLYQNLLLNRGRFVSGLPDSIIRKERDLRQLIGIYTTRLNQNTVEKDAGMLQQRLLSYQVALSRLYHTYRSKNDRSMYGLWEPGEGQTLESIQQLIGADVLLLDYYVTDSLIYGMALGKHDFTVQLIPNNQLFRKQADELLRELYTVEEGRRYNGMDAAYGLYQQLVRVFGSTVNAYRKWVIIPDDFLYQIPFDALVSNKDKKEYLLLSKTISYHYSISLLLEEAHLASSGRKMSAKMSMSPFSKNTSVVKQTGLSVLPFSANELSGHDVLMYDAEQASKQKFLSQAPRQSVIHLATHASTGEDSSMNWIQFYPSADSILRDRLFLHEIYAMNLDSTSLLVLSACETAGGAAQSGEGLMSLSRAFMYAGADAVLSTLWKTEDRVSNYLMQKMYVYMQTGLPPEEALRKAKINLLTSGEIGARYLSPNYWANFVYAGHVDLHKGPGNNHWHYIITGLAAVLIMGFLFFMKKPR